MGSLENWNPHWATPTLFSTVETQLDPRKRCEFLAFAHLVEADILITGQSTFSHFAGLLSNKYVLVDPAFVNIAATPTLGECRHSLPTGELRQELDKKGNFDHKRLLNYVSTLGHV